MRILIVEDDIKITAFIKKGLEEELYSVDVTHNGDEAIYLTQLYNYDIILLDIMIPDRDGLSVCKILREKGILVPIIILSARNLLQDKIDGLDSGANDYLTKPFAFEELLARIRVQLRDSIQTSNIITIENLSIDINYRIVKREGNKISLTVKEYALLELLVRNRDKIVTELMIKENLTDMSKDTISNIINVYIYRLRNKIDKNYSLKLIHTIHGVGYMLSDKDV